jgi:hypothetical protein
MRPDRPEQIMTTSPSIWQELARQISVRVLRTIDLNNISGVLGRKEAVPSVSPTKAVQLDATPHCVTALSQVALKEFLRCADRSRNDHE